ncbi:allophanate hydrolase [Cerasicoccus frondis]|uniref:allophanate hydrolase n=1 Tax=Cerasicoccus frondis TaxID=490090 RepID=UPI002852CC87|nr:allophanate hydrolase [Cerasicoccus frondis]
MDFSIPTLRKQYADGALTPGAVVEQVLALIKAEDPKIWIHVLSPEELAPYVDALAGKSVDDLPLYGIPFAIKDNIDLAGVPTTAACPEFSFIPEKSAFVVERLIAAGAIPIGKTNLDQFATGLVGTRSPYGIPSNSFDPRYISGGSSSGSAVSVAKGLVSFSLGTDTAGSGRVPASLNNLVGLKPSRGLLSTTGLLPACRSLDCISIFSLSCSDASTVLDVARGFDAEDPYSVDYELSIAAPKRVIGIPQADQLEYFGDKQTEAIFLKAVDLLRELDYEVVEIDFAPFQEAARLLYHGPWLAERYLVLQDLIEKTPEHLHPVTREIVCQGGNSTAVDFFRAEYQLKAFKRTADEILATVDAVMTPTCGTVYTIEQLLKDPIQLNTNLGHYTNFMNLLDLSAIAVPVGFRSDRIPHGVTFFSFAGEDANLLALAGEFHAKTGLSMGAGKVPVPAYTHAIADSEDTGTLVVCGAHLSGMPLNHQLTERGGVLLEATETEPVYRMYALDGKVKRPALVRVPTGGAAIEVEVWQLPLETIGSFLAGIAEPLGLGKVFLSGGRQSMGFIAEAHALGDAEEITELKSWRNYVARG